MYSSSKAYLGHPGQTPAEFMPDNDPGQWLTWRGTPATSAEAH